MPSARLHLVRHGETDWNRENRIQGHRPTALNETGRRQAEILARFFAARPVTAIWSSDLPRAFETAERIAAPHGLTIKTTPALRERDLAPLEGLTGDEVAEALSGGDFATWYDVPGVEGDEAVLQRVLPVLLEAREFGDEAVLVSHGGVQKTLLHHIMGIPPETRRAFVLGNGLVLTLAPAGGGWRVEGICGLDVLAPPGERASEPGRRVYLVRHGQTDWNLSGRIQGHEGTGLNETGRRQADLAARFLASRPLRAVWSSDLGRALETAERIALPHGLAVKPMAALRERDLAPLEGMDTERALALRLAAGLTHGDFGAWTGVPGVEREEDLLARLLPVLGEAGGVGGDVALVTHGGPQRAILHHVLGVPEQVPCGAALDNGTVVALLAAGSAWRVEGIHGSEMLAGLSPACG
ncbi:MAG: histidine phosphatase family protein [Patescibacteria group bacterium]